MLIRYETLSKKPQNLIITDRQWPHHLHGSSSLGGEVNSINSWQANIMSSLSGAWRENTSVSSIYLCPSSSLCSLFQQKSCSQLSLSLSLSRFFRLLSHISTHTHTCTQLNAVDSFWHNGVTLTVGQRQRSLAKTSGGRRSSPCLLKLPFNPSFTFLLSSDLIPFFIFTSLSEESTVFHCSIPGCVVPGHIRTILVW